MVAHQPGIIEISPDSELGAALREAEGSGLPLRVRVGERQLTLRVAPSSDLWRDYDPERTRAALKRSRGLLSGVDVEQLLQDLREQRE
jgi:hypothetical protein